MIALQSYTAASRSAFVAWMQADLDAFAFVGRSFPSVARDPERLFHSFVQLPGDLGHYAWSIRDQAAELLGHLELKTSPKVADRELELVYIVRREVRSRGVATSAVRQALVEARGLRSVSAIVAFINPLNVASQRVVEMAGFVADVFNDSGHSYRFHVGEATELRVR